MRAELVAWLATAPIAVCGSGTFGIASPAAKFSVVMGGRPPERIGSIALVCQSGGILNSIAGCLDQVGVGIEAAAATGGEDQLGAADFIDHFVAQGHVRAIGCVVEQLKNPALFRAACERAAAKNISVVFLFVGRSERGQQAAFAHSGSLASDARMLDALLEQVGAAPVANLTEMVSALATLAKLDGRPLKRNAAVITISGGETGLTADLAERSGLALPDLQPQTDAALRDIFQTPGQSYGNPVDTASGSLVVLTDAQSYGRCIDAVSADPGVDAVIARHLERQGAVEALEGVEDRSAKPVFLYTRTTYDLLAMKDGGAPRFIFPGMEDALATVGRIALHHERLAARRGDAHMEQALPAHSVALPAGAPRILMEHEVFPLLAPTGLAAPPFALLHPGDPIPAEVRSWPGPLIAKIVSQTIIHRRSAGGVAMNLASVEEAHRVAADMFAKFGDRISAVLIEPMLKPDLELILGAKQGPTGLAIMLGFGGTFVEDLGPIALRLSPLEARDAVALIDQSRARAAVERLAGAKAHEAVGKLVDIVRRFDALCRGLGPDLQEFDVNPIGFYAETIAFRALDAKIVLAKSPGETS